MNFCFDNIFVWLKMQFFAVGDLGQGHMTTMLKVSVQEMNMHNFCFKESFVACKK